MMEEEEMVNEKVYRKLLQMNDNSKFVFSEDGETSNQLVLLGRSR
jgi:hypothetical protein